MGTEPLAVVQAEGEVLRAWVFDGPGRLRLERRPLAPPGSGSVRVRIAVAGVCGSDIHGFSGESGRRTAGVVMGHELGGVVDSVGRSVTDIAPGDQVGIIPLLPCDGRCGHRMANRCRELRILGVHLDAAGGFADSVTIPADRVVRAHGLPPDSVALIEPLAVGLHAVRRAEVQRGDRILVVGGGMIGVAAALCARSVGGVVTVSDPMAARRAQVVALGLTAVEPARVALADPFDRAVDAVGAGESLRAALGAVGKGGTVVLVGMGQPEIPLAPEEVVAHERSVLGSAAYEDADYRDALGLVQDGTIDLSALQVRRVPFDALPEALARLAAGTEPALKVLMVASPPLLPIRGRPGLAQISRPRRRRPASGHRGHPRL